MKKKAVSLALALVMCLGLLPVTALAAEISPTDWNFLVLFAPMDADYEEDGAVKHVKTSISKDEVAVLTQQLSEFGQTMEEAGVIKPNFKNVQLPTPITHLSASSFGPWPNVTDIADYLKSYPGIDLDIYDHVIVYAKMDDVKRSYGGLTGGTFDNGTTYSFIPADYCLRNWGSTPKRPAYVVLHEFLHTVEAKSGYDLHEIEMERVPNYPSDEAYKACMLDIILNRITGEHGSGVLPYVWRYPPHVLRTTTELTIPNDITAIGSYHFKNAKSLERVVIPSSVTKIGDHAFQFCSSLSEVTLLSSISSIEEGTFEQCTSLTKITVPSGVTSIGIWAFANCTSLREITIPASVTSIGEVAFYNTDLKDVYYGGTKAQWKAIEIGGYNETLTKATIHYNSTIPGTQPTTTTQPTIPAASAAANPTNDSLEVNGKAADPTVYKIGGSNYFKIRDVAALLNGTEKQFAVGYDAALNSVTATTGQGYAKQSGDLAGAAIGGGKTAQPSNDTIYVNGKKVDAEVYKIDGSNYFKLRDLGKALNFYVGWTAQRGMYIETDKPYSE